MFFSSEPLNFGRSNRPSHYPKMTDFSVTLFGCQNIHAQIQHSSPTNSGEEAFILSGERLALHHRRFLLAYQLPVSLQWIFEHVIQVDFPARNLDGFICPLSKIRLPPNLKFSAEKLERTELGRPFKYFSINGLSLVLFYCPVQVACC